MKMNSYIFTVLTLAFIFSSLAGAELISNGDFSGGLTGWSTTADTVSPPVTIDTSDPPNPGNPSPCAHLAVASDPSYATGGIYQVVNVEAGKTYNISWDWAGALGLTNPRWAEVRCLSWNGSDTINSYDGDLMEFKNGGTWDWYHVAMTHTATTNQTAIVIGGFGTGGVSGWFAVDNISFEEQAVKNPLIFAPEISPISVDGDLSDWDEASSWADFGIWYQGGLASSSRAKYAWNDAGDMLYIGIESTEGNELILQVGGLMAGYDAAAKPEQGTKATQIQFTTWTGAFITIENQHPWGTGLGTTTGILADYTESAGTMTIEIAMPIYSNWQDDSTGVDLTAGMDIYDYVCIADKDWNAGDCQTTEGQYVYFAGKEVVKVSSLIRLLADVPATCDDVPDQFKDQSDINGDCAVNVADFAKIAIDWMDCTDPANANCD